MGNFTRGKDGKIYYGKGTQGGLAPTPPTFSPSGTSGIPPLPARPNSDPSGIDLGAIGSYSKFSLIKEGFTVEEIHDIETRPALADLPKTSWGKLALEEADRNGYDTISKLSGGRYLVAAGYDNLVENHRLEEFVKDQADAKKRAYESTLPIQKMLLAMKSSAVENNYSSEDVARIDRVMAGYTQPDHINTRAFTLDGDGANERIVYTHDMVRLLDLAKVAYKEEKANPSDGAQRLINKAEAQKRYMRSVTTTNASAGGFIKFDIKPSKDLIDARIKVKLLQEEYFNESRKSERFDLFGRQAKKTAIIKQKLEHFRKNLDILENRKTQ